MKIISFNILRYFLALCVLVGHSYAVLFQQIDANNIRSVCQNQAVDGFFILSGLLLAKSCTTLMRSSDYDPADAFLTLTRKRIKRLWPEYFFAIVVTFVLSNLFAGRIDLFSLPFNLVLLSQVNKIPGIVNGSWYVSSLFLVGIVLSALLIFLRKTAYSIFLPVISISSLLYLYCRFGHLSLHGINHFIGMYSIGFVKGFMDISLGMCLYFFAEYLRSNPFRVRKVMVRPILIALEVVALFLIAYAMTRTKVARTDYLVLFGFAILIPMLYLQKETLLKFLPVGGVS